MARLERIPVTFPRQQTAPWRMPVRRLPPALPLAILILIVLPLALLVLELATPSVELWRRLWETNTLPRMIQNTLLLMSGVGIGTLVIGVGFAWLVSAYQFPGRALFDHALLLPLAIPTFVMGFIFMATFDFAGPVQTQWRVWFGREAWFPPIRSIGGVIVVMTLVLYPYVYLLARAAFREQAASTFEAAQVMGYSRSQTFFRLVLPLARPSIAAGAVLAMMEAMTDYGTVSFFSVPTLSEGVVRIWQGRFDRAAATELASLLLIVALGIMLLERALRGRARYDQNGGCKGRRPARRALRGGRKWAAVGACLALLSIAFILPVMQLAAWAVSEMQTPSVGAWKDIYGDYIGNSVILSGSAALVVVMLAVIVAHAARLGASRRMPRLAVRLTTLGYAMPGAVVAAGVLLFVAPIDHRLTDFAERFFGRADRSLLLTGSMLVLVYAYVVRFMSVGFNSVESSLDKVTPNMEHAARTLGAKPTRVLWRIHAPLMSVGMAAGGILVFVDAMKELPATLLLRPFGMDTLALWSYFLAGEGFWQAAAIPSLTILIVGLIPVFILMRIGGQSNTP